MMKKSRVFQLTVSLFVIFFPGCAGQVSVPISSSASNASAASSAGSLTLQSIQPELISKGTEQVKIPEPNSKIKLPKKGNAFLYGLTVTEPLETFYQAVRAKDHQKALKALEDAEGLAQQDDLMRYSILVLRVLILIPAGQTDQSEENLRVLSELEKKIFGKDFESTALRGELHFWRGNLKAARSEYEKVLAAIGNWRVPTFYLRPPSNNNEIVYFGRAQLRAAIGLAGILIQEKDYESALAWAADSQKRFSDILGLTEHMIYGKYMKATPDLYTSHGWCLAFLAAARLGYSKDLAANEDLFQKSTEYFDIEGHIEGTTAADSLREYVLIQMGLAAKPTIRIGILPELSDEDRSQFIRFFSLKTPEAEPQNIPSLPPAPKSFLKLPRAGDESPFGFKITPEYEAALQAYLKGDGDEALSVLDHTDKEKMEPAPLWGLSYLRAQVLIMMGRAADAELELEKTAQLESRAFGTNLNSRALRGDARVWLSDYEAATGDFLQVIKVLEPWKLPSSYVFPPSDVAQLALRSRAQLRAHVGLAASYMFQGDYASAWKWAHASEELLSDLFQVLTHPVYQHYVTLDADMIYGRGLNLGIFGASQLAITKDIEGSAPFFQAAHAYLGALNYAIGQVTVDSFRVRVLFDLGENDLAESLADKVVSQAIEKGFSELVWQMEALRGEILLKQGREDEAETAFRRAQSAVEEVSGSLTTDHSKRRFGVGREDITTRLVERDIKKENWNDLFRDLEHGRARAFVDMLGEQHLGKGSEEQAVKAIRELDKKIRRQRLLNAAPGGAAASEIETEKELLTSRRQRVEELRKRDPELVEALSIQTKELSEIQGKLSDGEILAYALPLGLEEKIKFLLMDSKTARIETSELSQGELLKALKLFKSLNPATDADAQRIAADQLTKNLHLQNLGVKKLLYMVPSGELYFVPWGALEIDYPVVVLPTGAWIHRSPHLLTSTKPATVVGDPQTGGALPALPGAREEAKTVAQVYGVMPLLGEKATEKALRQDIATGTDILHLATHSFFDDKNPLDSAIILSTGTKVFRLTANHLFEDPLPARLVVLSGCETGLGQSVAGDDFLGLARSFYLGGTLAVIYSLWPVPDQPTKFFMEEFHRNAITEDRGKAWLMARNSMKEKGYAPSEYGAFILGGQSKRV